MIQLIVSKTCPIWECWAVLCVLQSMYKWLHKHVCNFARRIVGQEKCAYSPFVRDFSLQLKGRRKEGQTSVCASVLYSHSLTCVGLRHPTFSRTIWHVDYQIVRLHTPLTKKQECSVLPSFYVRGWFLGRNFISTCHVFTEASRKMW